MDEKRKAAAIRVLEEYGLPQLYCMEFNDEQGIVSALPINRILNPGLFIALSIF
ncbi:MAG: hypothetical protein IJ418_19655 [Clostridia bacterium]|nr:hypothetical protein [Clostridia bacterium]